METGLIRLGAITVGAFVLASCGSDDGTTGSSGSLPTLSPQETTAPTDPADVATTPPTVDTMPPTVDAAAPADSDGSMGMGSLPFGLELCGDFQVVSADPAFYRDSPVYVGNEQPIDEIRAWATRQPGYVDLWIDRDNLGWVVVGFDGDVAQRQADLATAFPGVGVAAAQAPYTQDELDALLAEVFDVMRANNIEINGGANTATGLASAYVGVLDEETLELFEPFAGRPVCFEGVDPADAVIDGPQATEGDGWRLLAVERTGPSYRTGVATTDAQYEQLWATSGVTADRPVVDFETEIAVWFGAVYGSNCEIRMDDVIVDLDRSIVHGEFVVPGNPQMCNSDANPETYLVALDRGTLPSGPFAVQLGRDEPPRGVPEERTNVSADLSAPGSIATDAEIGPDPALLETAAQGYTIGPGGIVEPSRSALYRLDLSCDLTTICPINGVVWASSSPTMAGDAWAAIAGDDGIALVDVLLEADPPTVTLSANGQSKTYEPVAASVAEPPCT
ncbi:MAG: hypothetical protein AAGA42_09045 [Actinomycetota bacterium]